MRRMIPFMCVVGMMVAVVAWGQTSSTSSKSTQPKVKQTQQAPKKTPATTVHKGKMATKKHAVAKPAVGRGPSTAMHKKTYTHRKSSVMHRRSGYGAGKMMRCVPVTKHKAVRHHRVKRASMAATYGRGPCKCPTKSTMHKRTYTHRKSSVMHRRAGYGAGKMMRCVPVTKHKAVRHHRVKKASAAAAYGRGPSTMHKKAAVHKKTTMHKKPVTSKATKTTTTTKSTTTKPAAKSTSGTKPK